MFVIPALSSNDQASSPGYIKCASSRASREFWTVAILLSLCSFVAFHLAPDLPFGALWDEPDKVAAVLNGTQNSFNHPIYMLGMIRLANMLVGASDPEDVARLGRLAASASGGLLVFSAIALARRAMGDIVALGAGVLTAVAPLTVLHAQLLKEDIFVAPWLILGVLALDHLVEKPQWRQAVFFGVTAGLAASAKYVGVILLPLSLLLPIWVDTDFRRYYRMIVVAATLGLAIFCVVNLPLFSVPDIFIEGLRGEIKHSLTGHLIVLHGWQSYFLFTWQANIWPGLRAPLALAGLGGMLIVAANWKKSPPVLRHTMIFAIAWYLVHELSPMKPFPEGARHMTVMAAVFGVFAGYAAGWLAERFPRRLHSFAGATMISMLAIIPAERSIRLVQSAPNDTWLAVHRIVASLSGPTVWAYPTTSQPSVDLPESTEELQRWPGFIVISEFDCGALPLVSVATESNAAYSSTSRRLRGTDETAGAPSSIDGGKPLFSKYSLSHRHAWS